MQCIQRIQRGKHFHYSIIPHRLKTEAWRLFQPANEQLHQINDDDVGNNTDRKK